MLLTNRFREEEAIPPAELRPAHRLFEHGELVAQGKVLEGELAVAAAEEREESKQVEQEGDHRPEIFSGSDLTDQRLRRQTGFWRRTRGAAPARDPIFSESEGSDFPEPTPSLVTIFGFVRTVSKEMGYGLYSRRRPRGTPGWRFQVGGRCDGGTPPFFFVQRG